MLTTLWTKSNLLKLICILNQSHFFLCRSSSINETEELFLESSFNHSNKIILDDCKTITTEVENKINNM